MNNQRSSRPQQSNRGRRPRSSSLPARQMNRQPNRQQPQAPRIIAPPRSELYTQFGFRSTANVPFQAYVTFSALMSLLVKFLRENKLSINQMSQLASKLPRQITPVPSNTNRRGNSLVPQVLVTLTNRKAGANIVSNVYLTSPDDISGASVKAMIDWTATMLTTVLAKHVMFKDNVTLVKATPDTPIFVSLEVFTQTDSEVKPEDVKTMRMNPNMKQITESKS